MKIALAGNVGSGKSTIAEQLSNRGFYLLSYTELIKEEVASAMAATGVTQDEKEALDSIHKDKEFYRRLLISWADATGWSTGERLKRILPVMTEENIVLDNIRFLKQAEIVKKFGFIVVKLEGGESIGEAYDEEFRDYQFDAIIPWMENIEKRVEYILQTRPKIT